MPFAAGLPDSLRMRETEVLSELEEGHSLEKVLDRHLLTVERMAEAELVTSVLLLSGDGSRLYHGAGPNLPQSYRTAIDGSEIGPTAGSCGTAAYLRRPVYATDITTDPLWEGYRDLALAHGLRSCWSTPIRGPDGSVIGTFAIYHRTVGGPTPDEIAAIELITDHVAAAILQARGVQDLAGPSSLQTGELPLKLVESVSAVSAFANSSFDGLLLQMEKLEWKATELDREADDAQSEEECRALRTVADDCRRLIGTIRSHIDRHRTAGKQETP